MKHITLAALLLITTQAQAVVAPAVCPAGQTPVTVFFDGFEAGGGNFTVNTTAGANIWGLSAGYPNTGVWHLTANPYLQPTQVTLSATVLNLGIPIAHNRYYMQFSQQFQFDTGQFDGGVMLYSPDEGRNFFDAESLIVAGQRYNGIIRLSNNPLAGALGFVNSSFGYQTTRLSLASSAGGAFMFGFVFGSDSTVNSWGWVIDDIHVYRCEFPAAAPPPPPPPPPSTPIPPPPPVTPSVPTAFCQGLRATIVGTEGDDFLNGTAGADVIAGLGGNDDLDGRGGNDIICGGPGADTIYGGRGKDRIYAGAGRDELDGESGNDKLDGGAGRDVCTGGLGNDTGYRCEVKRL